MAKTKSLRRSKRRGIVVLITGAFMLIAIMLLAVVVDVGFVALTKAQLQAGADSAALAAGTDLSKGLGLGAVLSPSDTQTLARQSAATLASNNRAGEKTSIFCDPARDVRFGNAIYDNASHTWTKSWNTEPYNMVGVSLLRNQSGSGSGDTPLPLFFSGLVGASANLAVDAVAALMPSNTIQIPPGGTSSLMPLAVPVDQWNALSTGNDNFHYDPATNTVSNGQDGIKEIDIYPIDTGTGSSRGLLDLGAGQSASASADQIRNGVTATDLANAGFSDGFTATPTSPVDIPSTEGLKASLKDDLTSIIGDPRAVVLYETLSNGTYKVIGFVGLRILDVKITGNNKTVWAQPATVVDPTFKPALDQPVTPSSVFSPVILIQ